MTSEANRSLIGQLAEQQAIDHLKSVNYTIITRNYRSKIGEIDIIARSPAKEWVFVEVKYRSHKDYGGGLYALTKKQQHRIRRTAERWLQQNDPDYNYQCRFDVIALSTLESGESTDIQWIEGAF